MYSVGVGLALTGLVLFLGGLAGAASHRPAAGRRASRGAWLSLLGAALLFAGLRLAGTLDVGLQYPRTEYRRGTEP